MCMCRRLPCQAQPCATCVAQFFAPVGGRLSLTHPLWTDFSPPTQFSFSLLTSLSVVVNSRGGPFSVEHPQSLWLWILPPLAALLKYFVQCASVSQNGCRSSASIQLVASGRDLSSLKIVDRSRADQLVASGLGPSPPPFLPVSLGSRPPRPRAAVKFARELGCNLSFPSYLLWCRELSVLGA